MKTRAPSPSASSRPTARTMGALGCRQPTVEPRVSETIPEIVALIEALIAKGERTRRRTATCTTTSRPSRSTASSQAARRRAAGGVRPRQERRGQAREHDFALWKAAKPTSLAGARWPSPWARAPGWHIECSAMTHAHLGDGFDLHGGGPDLKFPTTRTRSPRASRCGRAPMARAWMHHGFIEMDIERNAGFGGTCSRCCAPTPSCARSPRATG